MTKSVNRFVIFVNEKLIGGGVNTYTTMSPQPPPLTFGGPKLEGVVWCEDTGILHPALRGPACRAED